VRELVAGDLLGVLHDLLGLERHLRPARNVSSGARDRRIGVGQTLTGDGPQIELRFQVFEVEGEIEDGDVIRRQRRLAFRQGRQGAIHGGSQLRRAQYAERRQPCLDPGNRDGSKSKTRQSPPAHQTKT
jgi:hypothetical protein